jgi:glycosyltransferase involved in cell wall biosynthesis
MKILIYTGYHKSPVNCDSWRDRGSNGMAYTWQKLASQFAAHKHQVTVSGQVDANSHSEFRCVPTDQLEQNQHFDVVIAVAYLHFIPLLESRGITWDKGILWVHYHSFFPWYEGTELPGGGHSLFHDERLHHVVAASPHHAKRFAHHNPSASKIMHVIPHAIDPADWPEIQPTDKTPGRFLYTSAPSNGLGTLLDMWPRVCELIPNASLHIAAPDYAVAELDNLAIDQKGVVVKGLLKAADLYQEIKQAEYFLYPCSTEETYGLTALEMMRGCVSIVSTDTGNLGNLLEGRAAVTAGVGDSADVEAALLGMLQALHENPEQRAELIQSAYEFAEQQTWSARYEEWMDLFKVKPRNRQKHAELYAYFEDKEAWKERFLTYAARTKEWELVVDEPFESCFSFPLFTPEFCHLIRDEAEHADCWTTDRHTAYPTTDIVLEVLGLKEVYREILDDYVIPMARHKWALGIGWNNINEETFLAKYTPEAQGHLALHHDESDITCLIQLSDLDEYTGGGTYFSKQKELVKGPIGYASVHPGHITHRHGGRAISEGLRYIVVSFMRRIKPV